ncbi:MAG TPA: 2-dehydropantoate 2-reductase [Chloroflexia bacterium]|nr:2-dehydropantoate 2-reductase [Chloroflexia bacterium]
MTRIAIIGAGAIGSVLAGLLNRAGQEVTLIGRPDQVKVIQEKGLQVEGVLGSFVAPVAAATSLTFEPDFAFLTVKTQDVLEAVQANLEYLKAAPLVTFQNGVRSDEMVASLLPRSQIISAVVSITANYLLPGRVALVYPGSLVIGRPFGPPDSRLEELAALLRPVTTTSLSSNIEGAHWLKLIVNLNNALPAVTGLTLHQVYADPYLRRLTVKVLREGQQVVKKSGIRLESLPEISKGLFELVGRLPVGLAGRLLVRRARRLENEVPLLGSTLQSLQRGRPTEIDYLNGEIVRLGQQKGIAAPLNKALVEMIHQSEKSGAFWTAEEIRTKVGFS